LKYYENNHEERLEYGHKYYKENQERILKYNEENREKKLKYDNKYYKKNKKKLCRRECVRKANFDFDSYNSNGGYALFLTQINSVRGHEPLHQTRV
jgi:hypothetical protein